MTGKKKLFDERFGSPRGVSWTPVAQALTQLKTSLIPQTKTEKVLSLDAVGRIVAKPVNAIEANPPFTNSAVDGYGFKGPSTNDETKLSILSGRAAAGAPFLESLPNGKVLKILTGAMLPGGVDTVLFKEDVDENVTSR